MRMTIITMYFVLLVLGVKSQGALKQQIRAEYYADAAADRFDLDEEARNKVEQQKLKDLYKLSELRHRYVDGELTAEEHQAAVNVNIREQIIALTEIVGQDKKQVSAFFYEVTKEMAILRDI
ncbi:BAR domain-containing protein [Reichenbachiella versicolor]|uniref:hypothetical protein n=1 Tax=Reichenbachiella versicolor TaxID=1821036 RepID=UPI0013A58F50|nr:hypothetical protein [Reichenbachiella versicolor]